mgnify:CR=1 FL=1|jgi:hypothetical protein
MITKLAIESIIASIHAMDRQDLNRVVEAVKYARSQSHRQMAQSLRIGDLVEFQGRYGKTVRGTVVKTAIKYVQVDCGIDGKWRVPGAHLQTVKAA